MTLLLALVLAGAATRPTVQLRVWPPVVQLAPATYEARVIFRDPDKVATCPAFRLTWADEGGSAWEESSCDPYAAAELQPDEYRPPRRRHLFRTPGTYRVEVEVRGGDRRKVYRAAQEVLVHGPEEEH